MTTQPITSAAVDGPQYLSRGTDHLGSLQRTLRDLVGYRTLANELIQNADDSGTANESHRATAITFDVLDDRLIVENDGRFSDCGSITDAQCAWKIERGSKCDYHRFRTVAGGDKRNELTATGAFGIGFTSVYQITDRPELIASGRHWMIDELAEESKRIIICRGCTECLAEEVANTRFVLPFASSPGSPLREELKFTAFSEASRRELIDELEAVLPDSLLFLKSVSKIVLRVDGVTKLELQRVNDGDDLLLANGSLPDRVWHRLTGDFDKESAELKKRYPQIEGKRKSSISIVFSDDVEPAGLLYACLPTQQHTGLPFHINADFFPSSSRKDIVLESDFQSEWNRAALRAAARLLATQFARIYGQLTAVQLWSFIEAVFATSKAVIQGRLDSVFSAFWESLLPVLQTEPVILTTTGAFVAPPFCLIEYTRRQREFVRVFESVGLATPHEDIWSRVADVQLRSALGIATINIPRLYKAFEQNNLTEPLELNAAPSFFQTRSGLALAWDCVESFLTDKVSGQDRESLRKLALVPCVDGVLRPANSVRRADEHTVWLFRCIDQTQPFYVETAATPRALRELVLPFSVDDALMSLEKLAVTDLAGRLVADLDLQLLRWFSKQEPEFLNYDARKRLANLSIFPSTSGWLPLKELALPGDFKDELGLANLLDTHRLAGLRDFLVNLGAEELSFLRYVRQYLPNAFRLPVDPEATDKKLRAVKLLAQRIGALEDDVTKARLQRVPLIKCTDGIFRIPADVYLDNKLNVAILGTEIHRATWSDDSPLKETVVRLYQWLGVSSFPRDEDLAERVKSLGTPNEAAREIVRLVLRHLHDTSHGDFSYLKGTLSCLRTIPWLPTKRDETRWYRADELFLEYRSYLFSSQARFIDLPKNSQSDYSGLLQALGVRTEPDVEMVVRHLVHCIDNGVDVNEEIYTFLNRCAADPHIRTLQSRPCIAIQGRGIFRPDQVFWSEHPFGNYRQQLGSTLRKFSDLLLLLGVKETAGPSDARKVLLEIYQQKGQPHLPLGPDHDVVMNCWRLLSLTHEAGHDIEPEIRLLRNREVVPDTQDILTRPSWLYFDDRVGLKTKFGKYLERNLIPRPAGADSALKLAGVRSISEVVEAQLTHEPQITPGLDLLDRIETRREQLRRVLEFHKFDPDESMSKIEATDFRCVDQIRVRYLAGVFEWSEPVPSEQEQLQAHFDGSGIFYFIGSEQIGWRELAKELALVISPEGEPGLLAASIKEVLAAASPFEAEGCLNDLGFPPATVDISDIATQAPAEQIGEAGGEFTTDSSGVGAEEGTPNSSSSSPDTTFGSAATSTGSVSGASRKRSGQPQSRLPVYVGTATTQPEAIDTEARDRILEVDRVGIERVIQAEIGAGRQPLLMPHNHPGFDIEARNEEGEIERLIEVKSTAAAWRERGVAMSREQFNCAEDAGITYWLYVVEKALDDDYTIHRIQNPAKQANEFVFDGGWRLLSAD